MRHFRVVFCLAVIFGAYTFALAQQIRVLSESVIGTPQSGSHDWYDIEVDPDSANNLIACGMKWSAEDNAYYGYVYASRDGGRTWRQTLEDKSSKWVSEESCAFGVHGIAYFIADASNVDETGMLHLDRGTTRIWVTHDSGQTWRLGSTAGWTDFSTSIVDRNPGANQNTLYIFFNNLWPYYASINDEGKPASFPKPTDKVDAFDMAGNTIGLISYKDGNNMISGPLYDPKMYKLGLVGSYPGQNLLLKDGSLLTLFWSKKRVFGTDGKQKAREFVLGSQRTDPQRKSLSEPVIVQKWLDAPGQPQWKCDSYLSAPTAYDPTTNTIYAVYLNGSNDKCTLMLATSTDDGQTWASSEWAQKEASSGGNVEPSEHNYLGLAVARRDDDGTLALLWHDRDKPNTWLFATSTDDAKTYSAPQQISTVGQAGSGFRVTNESLDFHANQARDYIPTDDAALRIDNHIGGGTVHPNGIAVTSDGIFHPIWTENGGQLYTASVAVIKPRDRNKPEPSRTDGWQYETSHVKITYGGSQRYDEHDSVLTETVVIRNSGTTPLRGPLRLEITPRSDVGVIYPLDAVTEGSGDSIGQYLDVSQYIPGAVLAPGASCMPVPLRFRFEPYSDAKQSNSVANVSLRLLSRGPEK